MGSQHSASARTHSCPWGTDETEGDSSASPVGALPPGVRLGGFLLFPHSVLVDDDAVKLATLKIRNSSFYPVAVTSLSSQVQYMDMVAGTHDLTENFLHWPCDPELLETHHCVTVGLIPQPGSPPLSGPTCRPRPVEQGARSSLPRCTLCVQQTGHLGKAGSASF